MARAHTQIGSLVAKLPPGPVPDPTDTPSAHLETAMSLLRQAISRGYPNLVYIRTDQALEPIHSLPDFQLLMMDLDFPADPFGVGR